MIPKDATDYLREILNRRYKEGSDLLRSLADVQRACENQLRSEEPGLRWDAGTYTQYYEGGTFRALGLVEADGYEHRRAIIYDDERRVIGQGYNHAEAVKAVEHYWFALKEELQR